MAKWENFQTETTPSTVIVFQGIFCQCSCYSPHKSYVLRFWNFKFCKKKKIESFINMGPGGKIPKCYTFYSYDSLSTSFFWMLPVTDLTIPIGILKFQMFEKKIGIFINMGPYARGFSKSPSSYSYPSFSTIFLWMFHLTVWIHKSCFYEFWKFQFHFFSKKH